MDSSQGVTLSPRTGARSILNNIWFVLLVALFLRTSWMVYARPTPVSDFEGYRRLAEGLLVHHQFGYPEVTAYRLPGYVAFLALAMVVNPSIPWLSLANILLSTALVYLGYATAWKISARREVALTAAWLIALNPAFIFFAPILATEHLFALLIFSALLVVLEPRLPSTWQAVLSGLLLGMAILTRGEALFYLPVILLASILYYHGSGRRVWQPIILLIVCILTVAPWLVRNWYAIGKGAGLATSGGVMFFYGHHNRQADWDTLLASANQGLDEIESSRHGYQMGVEYLLKSGISGLLVDTGISTLRLYAPNGYAVLWSISTPRSAPTGPYPQKVLPGTPIFISVMIIAYLGIACMAVLSLLFFKSYPMKMWLVLFGVVFMNWVCYGLVFSGTSRYRYTAEVVLCILAGVAWWGLRRRQPGGFPTLI